MELVRDDVVPEPRRMGEAIPVAGRDLVEAGRADVQSEGEHERGQEPSDGERNDEKLAQDDLPPDISIGRGEWSLDRKALVGGLDPKGRLGSARLFRSSGPHPGTSASARKSRAGHPSDGEGPRVRAGAAHSG